jgi:hypothetical protein
MRSPRTITKESLSLRKEFNALFISGSNLVPSPRLYKYYWWIYSLESPFENAEEIFFKDEHRLSTKQAVELIDRLHGEKISYAYVNTKYTRLGNKIWDYDKLKAEFPNIIFAPSYDDDTDEAWREHK